MIRKNFKHLLYRELLELSKNDTELNDCLIWVSHQAIKDNVNIYKKLDEILQQYKNSTTDATKGNAK